MASTVIAFPVPASLRPIEALDRDDRGALRAHFAALPPEDRRRRFGALVGEASIVAYLGRLNFARDLVFAIRAADQSLVAVAHLSLFEAGAAEIGLSVLPGWRGRGIGSRLFNHALVQARNHGVVELFMHCLASNARVQRMARAAGMRLILEAEQMTAFMELPPPTPATLLADLIDRQIAWIDQAVGLHFSVLRAVQAVAWRIGYDAARSPGR